MLVVIACIATLAMPPTASAGEPTPAYDLAGACVAMSTTDGHPVPGTGPSTMKAAALGKFLFYDTTSKVLTSKNGSMTRERAVTPAAVWTVSRLGSTYRVSSSTGKTRTMRLRLTKGCKAFPEAELDVTGAPHTGTDAAGHLRGFVDSHAHLMAEQFLGGRLHCGKPFSPLGITVALTDCPDHSPDGWPAVSEHVLSRPGPHSTQGWPTFKGWPQYYSLTHEQTYYRWLERAWRAGTRVINNYFVQNRVLCEIYPLKDEPCNEMQSVRIQHRRLLQMRDYIDAQAGGPGKGFLQIATDSTELRRIVESGKLAVTMGIEISEPFGCGAVNGKPQCTKHDIDSGLNELHRMGVRQVILTHKFDNALGGARMDSDLNGIGVEIGQVYAGQGLWQTEPCKTSRHDNQPPLTGPGQCNVRGLTSLGEYAVKGLIARKMVIDVDHLSVKAADRVLDMVDARHYPGVASSHSWTDVSSYRRILATGGMVGLYASGAQRTPGDKHSESFIDLWRKVRSVAAKDKVFGLAYGPDMNGLGNQAPPRTHAKTNPVRYPFTMPDGTRVNRQRTGTRVFDINTDGNAHYGLIPDWIESLRVEAGPDGNALIGDMYRAAEAYAQTWERTERYGG